MVPDAGSGPENTMGPVAATGIESVSTMQLIPPPLRDTVAGPKAAFKGIWHSGFEVPLRYPSIDTEMTLKILVLKYAENARNAPPDPAFESLTSKLPVVSVVNEFSKNFARIAVGGELTYSGSDVATIFDEDPSLASAVKLSPCKENAFVGGVLLRLAGKLVNVILPGDDAHPSYWPVNMHAQGNQQFSKTFYIESSTWHASKQSASRDSVSLHRVCVVQYPDVSHHRNKYIVNTCHNTCTTST